MDLFEEVQALGRKCKSVSDKITSEEATKNTLVMPFIKMLGYDPFDLNEVVPEFTAAIGEYKDRRVDYAIMSEGKPIIIIECKPYGDELNSLKCAQLMTYFIGCEARVAILTDGNRYLFFSDLEEPNKMDSKPYMEFVLEKPDSSLIPELKKLMKGNFNIDEALNSASLLKYTREFKRIMAEQLKSPDDDFLKFFVKQCYDGAFTSNVKERFAPILTDALNFFIKDKVNERLANAINDVNQGGNDGDVSTSSTGEISGEGLPNGQKEETEPDDGIITTDEEKEAYFIIKSILMGEVAPKDIILNDFKSFCNICYERKGKVFVRLFFNKAPLKIGFLTTTADGKKDFDQVQIDTVEDIYQYADRIKASIKEVK